MPCMTYKLKEDGAVVIACTRGRRRTTFCAQCQTNSATKLCDFPLSGKKAGQTCDRPLCVHCAVSVGKDKDYCAVHHRFAKKNGILKEG